MSGLRLLGPRLVWGLVAAIVVLMLAGIAAELYEHVLEGRRWRKVISFVSLDKEANLPTWFSSMLLAASALLTLVVGTVERGIPGRPWRHWYGLTAIFVYLSMDEAARLHERFIDPIRDSLDLGGALQFAWIVIAIPVVIATVVLYARFVSGLPDHSRTLLILAACLYVGGAVGMEAVSGAYRAAHGAGLGFGMLTVAEETLEMAGSLLALVAVALYARVRLLGVSVRLEDSVVVFGPGGAPDPRPSRRTS